MMRWNGSSLHYGEDEKEWVRIGTEENEIIEAIQLNADLFVKTKEGNFIFYQYSDPYRSWIRKIVYPTICPCCNGTGHITEVI